MRPSRRTLADFLTEWLESIRHSIKKTTYQCYRIDAESYVLPLIGQRKLQGITVPMLNALYRQLLKTGRRKPDNNALMYEYWLSKQEDRGGLGPPPKELAAICGTTIHAASAAASRYRQGRTPTPKALGLAPKSVKNIHRMLHRAFKDAVAWQYISFNPAQHASLPRIGHQQNNRPQPWTLDQLGTWLNVALTDRFAGMWVLAATTGMRRSELAGVDRESLDLENGTIALANTRVVVGGRVEDSDGKTKSSNRTISLDSFTITALRS